MQSPPKSLLFIPVWNQIEELPRLLDELREVELPCDTVLFVNNGSTDGSEKLIRESGYEYIDLPKNLGIGHGFIQAVRWGLERDYEVFGVIAGNGKMPPRELSRVFGPVLRGELDYVTGSRFLKGGDSPNLTRFRRASIPLVNFFVWILMGARLSDATCGYRAMRLDIFRHAEFDWQAEWLNTYEFEYYVEAKVILDRDLRWREVPVTMRYPANKRRVSKIRPFVGWYAMLKPWVIARFDGERFSGSAPWRGKQPWPFRGTEGVRANLSFRNE